VSRSHLAQLFFCILPFFVGRRPITAKKSLDDAKSILLFKPDGIGDTILWSAVLQEFARRCPQAKITLLCCAPTGELIRCMFPDWVIVQMPQRPKNTGEFLKMFSGHRELRTIPKHEVLIDLRPHRSSWELLYTILLRATLKVGLEKSPTTSRCAPLGEKRFFDQWVSWHSSDLSNQREIDCAELGIVRQFCLFIWGGAPESVSPDLRSVLWPRPKLLVGKKYWVISPFSGHPIRDYPLVKWEQVFQQLVSEVPGPDCLLICGAPSQRTQAEIFKESLQSFLPVENLCGSLQLGETAGVLLQSELVFATESALAHLSVALRKPTVAILGGGHYGLFAPWGTKVAPVNWIWNSLDCYGCNWSCIYPSALCITDLPALRIVNHARALLIRGWHK